MIEKKLCLTRSLALLGVLALLITHSVPAAQTIWAAPAQTSLLDAIQDAYTDINLATTNFDQGLLNAANSPGPPAETDVTTKQIFLAFDLSGVEFEIRSAVLRLSTLTCGGLVPVDAVDVTVYGVANDVDWAENTLTWDNQPEISTAALVSLDAGATVFDAARTYSWTDGIQGDLATWLEIQRSVNDGRATLVLVIENADDPSMADVFFEDREGSGATYGCLDALGGPTLEVSSSFISGYTLFLPLVNR